MKHRCSSCGYVGEAIDPEGPVYEPEVAVVKVVEIIPAIVQLACCPLCREMFEDPELYAAHRDRNCAAAPVVDPPAVEIPIDPTGVAGDPLVTDPNPDPPAGPQE